MYSSVKIRSKAAGTTISSRVRARSRFSNCPPISQR